MEQSPSIAKLADALRKFQVEIGAIAKSADNPFFKSKYAPLEEIIAAIKQPLSNEGLSFSQFPEGDGLTTVLMHESGEWMRATMRVHIGSKPQEQGSAITYARRYALSAVLGLATEQDDDGNAASQPVKAPVAAKTAPQRTEAETRTLAAKERIVNNLCRLGLPNGTKEEVSQSVFDAIGYELTPDKFDEIGEALGKLSDKKK